MCICVCVVTYIKYSWTLFSSSSVFIILCHTDDIFWSIEDANILSSQNKGTSESRIENKCLFSFLQFYNGAWSAQSEPIYL